VLIFGREIFRRIYGAKYGNGGMEKSDESKLEELNKGENIV